MNNSRASATAGEEKNPINNTLLLNNNINIVRGDLPPFWKSIMDGAEALSSCSLQRQWSRKQKCCNYVSNFVAMLVSTCTWTEMRHST